MFEVVPLKHIETIEDKVRAAFPEDADTAVRVMICESLASTTVISKTNDYGLFQVNKYAHNIGNEMLDADTNIAYARKLYDLNGWGDWYMSRHCWEK